MATIRFDDDGAMWSSTSTPTIEFLQALVRQLDRLAVGLKICGIDSGTRVLLENSQRLASMASTRMMDGPPPEALAELQSGKTGAICYRPTTQRNIRPLERVLSKCLFLGAVGRDGKCIDDADTIARKATEMAAAVRLYVDAWVVVDGETPEPTAHPTEMDTQLKDLALTANESDVLKMLSQNDATQLHTLQDIQDELPRYRPQSRTTIRKGVTKLISEKLAERPEGKRCGARLTRDGRILAQNIAD